MRQLLYGNKRSSLFLFSLSLMHTMELYNYAFHRSLAMPRYQICYII